MHVEALMTKDVKTCVPSDSLQAAAKIMWDRDCGCVPVVDDSKNVVGMITDRDICMATMLQGARPQDIAVEKVMSRGIHTCQPQNSIEQAEKILETHRVRRLPVTDGAGRLIGLISINDIAREAEREFQAGASEVKIEGLAEALSAVCTPRGQVPASAA